MVRSQLCSVLTKDRLFQQAGATSRHGPLRGNTMELGVGKERTKVKTQEKIIEGVKWDTRGNKMIKQLLKCNTYATEYVAKRKLLETLKTQ